MSLPTSGTCARDFECECVCGVGWGRWGGGVVNVIVPTKGTMSVFGTKDEREEGGEAAERSGSSVTLHGRKQGDVWTGLRSSSGVVQFVPVQESPTFFNLRAASWFLSHLTRY